MDGTQINLNSVCRTCKCEAYEMKPLYYKDFESGKEDPRLDEMLMACTSVQVNIEDGLPKLICRSCYMLLKNAYLFKKQSEQTDLFLRDYLKWLKNAESTKSHGECADDSVNTSSSKADLHETDGQKMDYIQIVDNNLTVYECKTCSKVFYTLEGLSCHNKIHTSKSFKCNKCNRSYTRLSHLQKHELSHGKRKMHVCKICKKTLPTLVNLKRHLLVHSKEKSYDCSSCNRGFNRSEHLQNHIKSCKSEKVYVCDICNKVFMHESSMKIHRVVHEDKVSALPTLDNEEQCMKIEFDDKTYEFSDLPDEKYIPVTDEIMEPEIEVLENNDDQKMKEIEEPMTDIYSEVDQSDVLVDKVKIEEVTISYNENGNAGDDEQLDINNDYERPDNVYSECPPLKTEPNKRNSRKSVKHKFRIARRQSFNQKTNSEADPKSTTYECPRCKLIFNELNIFERHAEQHGLKMYECEICLKKFSRCKNFKIHKLSHLKTKSFACTTCNKCFSKQNLLKKHMKLHTSTDVFSCEICQAVFVREETLKKHTALKHQDTHMKVNFEKKTFPCKTCEKSFLSKSHLIEHMKFHDGSKKFMCSECGKRFTKNDYLVIHMRRHLGEKPFKCKFCRKGFPRSTDLTEHERYHTGEKPHLCVMCGKGFVNSYKLTVHMRTHTGEKPYNCTYCETAFTQSYDLKIHIRRKHTGERFKCELCPETFVMGYELTQHKRIVHGLNITSNIRRLKGTAELNPNEPPPTTVPLPELVVVEPVIKK